VAIDRWPTAERLVGRLFRSRWRDLHEDYSRLPNVKYPGVYLLAYANKRLLGQSVREKDVFYVGMSHAGVSTRLKQFIGAIETGQGHSAGNRFFRGETHKKGYSKMQKRKTFFVASFSIPCNTLKERRKAKDLRRKAKDLRKMGLVAALEYYCLARIREVRPREPKLNKK